MTATWHHDLATPVGTLRLLAGPDGLTGLQVGDPADLPPTATTADAGPFAEAVDQLQAYLAGERTAFDLPLAPVGTPFQHQVWALLAAIPYGTTRAYGELAADLGDPGLSRAVGAANGRNPIAIIVPCHRVVGADGRLTGYAWGVDRKRWLLDMERRVTAGAQAALPGLA